VEVSLTAEINYHKIAAMATFNKQYKIFQEAACIKMLSENGKLV